MSDYSNNKIFEFTQMGSPDEQKLKDLVVPNQAIKGWFNEDELDIKLCSTIKKSEDHETDSKKVTP